MFEIVEVKLMGVLAVAELGVGAAAVKSGMGAAPTVTVTEPEAVPARATLTLKILKIKKPERVSNNFAIFITLNYIPL